LTERTDIQRYKPLLREYLVKRGIKITKTDAERISCLSGTHADTHPSMIVYAKEGNLYCPACGAKMDIFEAARIIAGISSNKSDFPKVIEEVKSTLGMATADFQEPATAAPAKKHATKNTAAISLTLVEARKVYVKPNILEIASKSLRATVTEIESTWKNLDTDGKIAFTECRFPASDFKDGKKKYLTFWYDGEYLRAKDPPYFLYNRDKLAGNPDLPVCIHEGPKCVFTASEQIPEFIHTGWNSGGKKLKLVDYEPIRGRTVIIYPDDDAPGRQTAIELKKILEDNYECTVQIREPLAEARTIKPEGADIVEALQVRTPEEVAEYLRSGQELLENENGDGPIANTDGPEKTDSTPKTVRPPSGKQPVIPAHNPKELPFRILGTADDGNTYLLDESERLHTWRLSSLTKGNLIVLASLRWWENEFAEKGKVSWDDATDFVVRIANRIDFDPDCIRGCGAWREDDGRICYNNGRQVIGESSDSRIYLKGNSRDLGLEDEPASLEIRREMATSALGMSFETPADAVRLLSWSVLAPFGGALPWRPAGLVTGDSESGKTTALNIIVRMLSGCGSKDTASGGETSAAGIRQHDKDSSRPVVIEEAEDDSEKKRRTRAEQFSLMRESTSDDAPRAWKGTIDGKGMQFTLRKMFIFAAISPIVDAKADENRLFFVNMVKGDSEAWKRLKPRAIAAFSEQKCRAVRAFAWMHLKEIVAEADRLAGFIEEIGHRSSRYAYLEGILYSAYWIVFKGRKPEDEELRKFLAEIYKTEVEESRRNDAEEIVERILDEPVPVAGDRTKTYALRRILYGIKFSKGPSTGEEGMLKNEMRFLTSTEIAAYKSTAIMYGLGIDLDGNLAIANEHHQIQRITGLGKGYKRFLWRHPCVVDRSKIINFMGLGDKPRRCTVFRGVIENDEIPF